MQTSTQVLIVGGSLNGLSAALFLSHYGVDVTVIERHPSTTVQYKFAGASPRTMEIYRSFGIEEEIRAHRTGDQKSAEIVQAKNLADPDPKFLGKPWADTADLSAATAETIDQDRLEPILRDHAEKLGARVHFNTELVDFEQDQQGVRATLRDLSNGAERAITAAYLIAADGVGGTTREKLGIDRRGPGFLQHWMNLIFDSDLEPVIGGKRFTSCFVTDVNGSFTPREDRWLLAVQYQPERGEKPEDFDPARTRELVRQGAGREDVRADLHDARAWDVAALVAERFREGRVFLVGDAAHAIPPTGGFGGNTGIHDVHNLAWKLAFVLGGQARPDLLDSYDSERRAVADATLAQALARLAAWFQDPSKKLPPAEPIQDDYAVIFGHLYNEGALVPDEDCPPLDFENPREPSGRPGSRAPHMILSHDGDHTAVHDLFGRAFVLLIGEEGGAWRDAAADAIRKGYPLTSLQIARDQHADQPEGRFTNAYGVGANGAVLVRPDGFIAWRAKSADADPKTALRKALNQLAIDERE